LDGARNKKRGSGDKETNSMAYLIAELWPFMLLALLVGIAVGWYSVES